MYLRPMGDVNPDRIYINRDRLSVSPLQAYLPAGREKNAAISIRPCPATFVPLAIKVRCGVSFVPAMTPNQKGLRLTILKTNA